MRGRVARLRRGIAFIRAAYGDADEIAPSLYLEQRKRTAGAEVEEALDTVEPTPVAPAPVTTTDVISTA